MEILQTKTFFKSVKTLTIIGYSLCSGSIASLIALNVIAGKNPTIEFLYWQRIFSSPIIQFITMPGIVVFLLGNIGWFLTKKKKSKISNILLVSLPVLLLINGQFILIPLANTINQLAVEQLHSSSYIQEFATKKATEDICGGINLLFLLSYLVIYIFTTKSKTNNAASR